MSEQDEWQEENARYLTVALAWLRLRLERQAQRTLAQAQPEPITDEQVEQKAAEMQAAEAQMAVPPAMMILCQRLGLSDFERETLLLCVALELDTRIAALCAAAQGDTQKAYPTFALALALFAQPSWDTLSPERPLRHWHLIEISQAGAQPLTTSPIRADERIVNYVKGLNYLDDRLAAFVVPLEVNEQQIALPPSQQQLVESMLRHWRQAAASASALPVMQLVGPDASGKQLLACHAAARLGRQLSCIPLEMLPSSPVEIKLLARLWGRESLLLPLALYLDAQELDSTAPTEGQASPLSRFLAHSDGLFFLGTRELWPRLGRVNISLDIAQPTPAEQQAAWNEMLSRQAPGSPGLLASQFNLNLHTIYWIAQAELHETSGDAETLAARLWDACRMRARPRLDTLAERLEPKATWDDLVLPDEEASLLRSLADQVVQRSTVYETWGFAQKMSRGLGINTLFAGESGTGKTMAAEVIANHLRLNLYRIDLSAVVSKYIGETEKNLRRLFDAAEDGGALLFFDEADALFGKRSEVKDSHDRYANIEINYLLQRMEGYRGLAILATNMKSALDTAFLRRLRFVITFPFPGPGERKRMWQRAFPPNTPTDSLDYDWLARFNLTGGNIANVALNAAFLAAQAGTPVTMPLILAAARTEFRKLERYINEAEFVWQMPPVVPGLNGVSR